MFNANKDMVNEIVNEKVNRAEETLTDAELEQVSGGSDSPFGSPEKFDKLLKDLSDICNGRKQ